MELAAALLKALRNFVQRDMIYVLGGFSVLLSGFVAVDSVGSIFRQDRVPVWLFIIGVSYVLGFSAQELFSFVGFTTTSALFRPRPIDQALYERYMREKWKDTKDFDQYAVSVEMNESSLKDRTLNDLERVVCLLLLTATMGPCAGLSGVIIALSALRTERCGILWIAVPVFLLGLVLIETNRVKAAQYRRYVYALYSHVRNPRSRRKKSVKK